MVMSNKPSLVFADRSPDFYDEISTNNNAPTVYDDFEQMLMRAGSYNGGGRLQSDTLRDLEGTLALAQEMKRSDHHSSFMSFANLATDRQQHYSCDATTMVRPVMPNQMVKKLSTSAPPYSQWTFTSHYQLQQHQQHQQQLLIPKQEDYQSPFLSSHHQYSVQSQPTYTELTQPMHHQHQQQVLEYQFPEDPPQLHLVEETSQASQDFLPSAEDLLGDTLLQPLGIEPMPPIDSNSPYCNTPLFGSSILGSPLSSSLLNTPVPTPGKLTSMASAEASPSAATTTVTPDKASSDPAVVVKLQPPTTPDLNESCIQKASLIIFTHYSS